MYDAIVATISLTSDECILMKELLQNCIEQCVSIGEEITIRDLLKKLDI